MPNKTRASTERSEFYLDAQDVFSDALMLVEGELAKAPDIIDVHSPDGKEAADRLCLIANALPLLAGVKDQISQIGYSGAMLGLSVEGISKRTAARYDWYYGLHGGAVFATSLAHYDLIPRSTDEFWYALTRLQEFGGTLSYEINQVFTHGLPASARRTLEISRSAVFGLVRDIVLATLDDDCTQRDFGTLAVSWPLDAGGETILKGMCGVLQQFNKLNQHLHRIFYLDSKGREKRRSTSRKAERQDK